MGLSGKKTFQVDIKCNGDVFFRYRLADLLIIAPEFMKSCELQEGEWGAVGSIVNTNYALDGRKQFVKHSIEAVDEEDKLITFKVHEGDLLTIYKSFKVHLHVNGTDDKITVTWTFVYDKTNDNIPDPDSLAEAAQNVTKYVETRLNPDLVAKINIPQLQ
ncbi:hypothetical protein R6Q59_012123 [Mikania micrantha]|uniref:Bet v I/Major latex protein domain-containing protein n=1 Tax=Mikania micrantha TaxID=192012 RepID=A0A5N6LMY0_9ASTR|nr:hypothetical protein E3N88_40560 [Mikania micrantha]